MAATHFKNKTLVSKLAHANTQFALDLFKQVTRTSDNIFLSPVSISAALAMTRLGATSNTGTEMDRALKWEEFSDEVHTAFDDYLSVLNAAETSYTLTMANRIFVHNKQKLLEQFVEKTVKHFKAEAVLADFVGNPEGEKKVINEWVESQTNKKIKNIIANIDPLTRLILINAIYFKGDWEQKFTATDTIKSHFKISSSQQVQVDMMRLNKSFPLSRNEHLKCQILEMPYVNKDLSMFILLPFEVDGLVYLEEKLDADKLGEALSSVRKQTVDITFPKFVLESTFSLEKILPSLGMVDAFDVNKADFSAMTGSKDLYISQVVHKAFLEVNEEGSEAAAATGVVMLTRCLPISHPFVADHPFLFLIRDNRADMVLFIGKLAKP